MSGSVFYLQYDPVTLEIVASNRCGATHWPAAQQNPFAAVVQTPEEIPFKVARSQYFIQNGSVVPRVGMGLSVSKTSFIADGADEVTIGGIPSGAVVMVSGAVKAGPETITDGSLTLTSTTVGLITVAISAPPAYFDWSITLNAT